MFATLLDKFLPRCTVDLFVGGDSVYVLSNGDSASLAYILEPHLRTLRLSVLPIRGHKGGTPQPPVTCSTVVITRYVEPHWLPALRRFKEQGGRIIYFMDDDLLDPDVTRDLPSRYAHKIRKYAASKRTFLEQYCDEFWVSSPYLAFKYAHLNATVLHPRPDPDVFGQSSSVTVCYHGTASHAAELAWLPPIISAVQKNMEDAHFEVFGDHQVNKKYRDIPRVSVLHPMSWQNYLAYTGTVRRDIALAPLLPQPFNKGRGPTKFFDFVRMGAVGLYTDVPPYRDFVRNGVDGILLSNEPNAWINAISELAREPARRQAMAAAARTRAVELAQKQI
jgi:glycosyltransferase involved in cell wall biosynthesis